MNRTLTSILISIVLFSCNPDKNKRADPEKLKFSTTDDAELFFKNLRQKAYDKEEVPGAKLQVFRHSERTRKADHPLVHLAIVVNWLYDEAYLLVEPNESINSDEPIQIRWQDPETGDSGIHTFNYGNKEDHLRFAGQLYSSILDGHELEYILRSGSTPTDEVAPEDAMPYNAIPFLSKPKERDVFRVSMFDYYRLTGNIR